MISVRLLQKIIADLIVEAGFGTLEVELTASGEPERADLCSSICIEIAARQRRSVNAIAKSLVHSWGARDVGILSDESGYLNLMLPSFIEEFLEPEPYPEERRPPQIQILIPVYRKEFSIGAYLRVCARVLLQYLLARERGLAAEVFILDTQQRLVFGSMADLWQQLTSSARDETSIGSQQGCEVALRRWGSPTDRAGRTLWLLPDSISCDCYRALFFPESSLTWHIPRTDLPWLRYQPSRKEIAHLLCPPPGQLIPLVLLLAQELSGHDVDLFSAGAAERANLAWYMAHTHQRLAGMESVSEDRRGEVPHLNGVMRLLAHYHRFSSWYSWMAASQGAVGCYLRMIMRATDGSASLLNNPHFRRQLREGTLSLQEWKILAGVRESLSAIIE